MQVKLQDKDGQIVEKPGLSIESGECVFPFIHQDQEYNECYKGKRGDWCATKISAKSKKMKRWAYCKPAEKVKIKIKITKKKPFNPETMPANMQIVKTKMVKPAYYVMPNKKGFINWFDSMYSSYKVKKDSKLVKSAKFSFFNHQKIIRDYMDSDSPYRGILLYHGLGVGKTCGSIAIAEGFRSDRKIIVLLNKSLEQNFRVNLKKCGFEYFRINQHWEFHKFDGNDQNKKYARHLGIPLKHNLGGVWLIDFTKEPNYETLSQIQHRQLDEQIDRMIDAKYTFYSMDGLTEKHLNKMVDERVFDNSILIVDEVHNITNAMSKGTPGVRAKYLEKLIMEATNLKLVFLSGTPMINNLFETAKLFNLLRGKIPAFEISFKGSKTADINWVKLENELAEHALTDQIIIKKRDNFITVTRVPNGYAKSLGQGDVTGIRKTPGENNLTDAEFKTMLAELVPSHATINTEYYTALPDDSQRFNTLFYDDVNHEIKNTELFKSRIMGLVSFYRTQDKDLLPTVRHNEVVEVPMSEYQFIKYANVRKDEIKQDKKRESKTGKSKKTDIFEAKSSYRAYSRMHCSFAFPESIERPLPVSRTIAAEKVGAALAQIEALQADEMDGDGVGIEDAIDGDEPVIDMKKHIRAYDIARKKALNDLYDGREEYLIQGDKDKLAKYSPKYNLILEKIKQMNGLAFVYTEYKTLEGITILSLVLRANGYAEFKLKKNDKGEYVLDENAEDKDKPKFAFWAGSEEQSDLLRKIYNNEFSELPTVLRKQLEAKKANNLRGDVIKVLLTTKTGAEGIDLKNVRQVHIVEPYWNPVRLQQVKGRAVRVGSHLELPPKDRLVDIYVYIAIMLPKDVKTEPIIERDSDGISSDQALFNLSEKKLNIMKMLLTMIKEVSIDCSLNINDTQDTEDPFTCLNYGSSLKDYSFIPNINDEYEDKEKRRRTKQTSWKPIIINIPKKGKFALKPAPPNEKQLLFDLELLRESGRPGEPVGEIIKKDNGKTTVKMYTKTK
jgi:superfamily II DNA or RNA helicase